MTDGGPPRWIGAVLILIGLPIGAVGGWLSGISLSMRLHCQGLVQIGPILLCSALGTALPLWLSARLYPRPLGPAERQPKPAEDDPTVWPPAPKRPG